VRLGEREKRKGVKSKIVLGTGSFEGLKIERNVSEKGSI
jgi:hypothetical protein